MVESVGAVDSAVEKWRTLHRYRAWLITLARRMNVSHYDAEDVASETILRAGTCADLDQARAQQFLAIVLRRIAVDRFRQLERERLVADGCEPEREQVEPAFEDRILHQIAMQAVANQAGLTEMEGSVIALIADGASHSHAAAVLSITQKASERALYRARKKLRGALSKTPPS
jgi:DNA-directed RNA polymerase specialized sigma24 family protein